MELKWISCTCNDKQTVGGYLQVKKPANYFGVLLQSNRSLAGNSSQRDFPPERMGSSPLACWGQDQNKITRLISICYGRGGFGLQTFPARPVFIRHSFTPRWYRRRLHFLQLWRYTQQRSLISWSDIIVIPRSRLLYRSYLQRHISQSRWDWVSSIIPCMNGG